MRVWALVVVSVNLICEYAVWLLVFRVCDATVFSSCVARCVLWGVPKKNTNHDRRQQAASKFN
jgi:hypothetical protein